MTRAELILILGALGIVVAGYVLDRLYWPDAFSRAGSVMVIYGVAMVGRALLAADRAHARNEARFEKLEAAYLDAGAAGEETTSPEAFSRLAKIYADLRESRIERESRLMRAEIVIVCIGTLIWGFGDLVIANPTCASLSGAILC